jgi:hypothetical protein
VRGILRRQQVEHRGARIYDSKLPPFTSTLKNNLPVETYNIHIEPRIKEAFAGWFIVKTYDASNQHQLYILEGHTPPNKQFGYLDFYRAAEYNVLCIRITPAQVKPRDFMEGASGYKGRTMTMKHENLLRNVVETPDHIERVPWGPRCFTYGGRRFVWKAASKSDDFKPETLYEYTKTWPKPGTRTGKKDDDAMDKPLFWESKRVNKGWVVSCVGGLDEAFKEFLFASQMAKLACMGRGLK